MQKFAVIEVHVTTEPGTSYFLLLKVLVGSVCEDNLAIMASGCLSSVLDNWVLMGSSTEMVTSVPELRATATHIHLLLK